MVHSLCRRITAALSMSVAVAAACPAIAHAAWTTATPNRPKLIGDSAAPHAGVAGLVPLTATPPAPSTPHLTGTFISNSTSSSTGTLTVGSMTLASGTLDNGAGTIVENSGIGGLGLLGTLNDNLGSIELANGTILGITGRVFSVNGTLIIDPTSSDGDISPTVGGVLTLTGSSTDSSSPLATYGTLSINNNDGLTITPPALDPDGPITLVDGSTLTSGSGSSPVVLNTSAVVVAPEPASLGLLVLGVPLLFKRRRA